MTAAHAHVVGSVVWATSDEAEQAGARLSFAPSRGREKCRPWLLLGLSEAGGELWASLSTCPDPEGLPIPKANRLGLRLGTHSIPGRVMVWPPGVAGFAWCRCEGRLGEGEIPLGLLIVARSC